MKDAVSWNRLAGAAGGTNTVEFGDGTSHFSGGGGDDKAKLGEGADKGSGGPGSGGGKLVGCER